MCESDGDLLSSAPGSSEWAVPYRISISSYSLPKVVFNRRATLLTTVLKNFAVELPAAQTAMFS
jgi:hypothetical protein